MSKHPWLVRHELPVAWLVLIVTGIVVVLCVGLAVWVAVTRENGGAWNEYDRCNAVLYGGGANCD